MSSLHSMVVSETPETICKYLQNTQFGLVHFQSNLVGRLKAVESLVLKEGFSTILRWVSYILWLPQKYQKFTIMTCKYVINTKFSFLSFWWNLLGIWKAVESLVLKEGLSTFLRWVPYILWLSQKHQKRSASTSKTHNLGSVFLLKFAWIIEGCRNF